MANPRMQMAGILEQLRDHESQLKDEVEQANCQARQLAAQLNQVRAAIKSLNGGAATPSPSKSKSGAKLRYPQNSSQFSSHIKLSTMAHCLKESFNP